MIAEEVVTPNENLRELDRRFAFHPFTGHADHEQHGPAAMMVRGQGVWLEDGAE